MLRTTKLVPLFHGLDFNILDDFATGGVPAVKSAFNMRVDISESENNFLVKADLPGFTKDNLNVDFKDGVLTVSAEKVETKESAESDKVWRKERVAGSVKRSFEFGEDVDADNIQASYVDGVLALTLPKKVKEEKVTKIKID